jgi:hypothetical protein
MLGLNLGVTDLVLHEETQWDVLGTKDHNLVTLFLVFICIFVVRRGI